MCITNGVLNGEKVGAIIVIPVIIVCTCSTVSDADGDIVKCRWAESAQGECGGVCQTFPAQLDQVCCFVWL